MTAARLIVVLLFVLVWALISGSFSIPNLLLGAVLAVVALLLVREEQPPAAMRVSWLAVARLAGLFVVELLKSGWRVARIAVRRDLDLRPAIIAYPLVATRDFQITLLANLITLTPGTLSVDVSEDRRLLFVHCVDVDDHDAVITDIRDGFEALILKAFR